MVKRLMFLVMALCILAVPAYAEEEKTAETQCAPCPKASSDDGALALRAHEKNFFMVTGLLGKNNEKVNGLQPSETQNSEAHFQVSVESAFIDGSHEGRPLRVYFAYTQRSFWQIFSDSAPFRENNYEPEVFFAYENEDEGPAFRFTRISLGAAHQSNGRAQEFSRSWNSRHGTGYRNPMTTTPTS
jgi:phospholipase A1